MTQRTVMQVPYGTKDVLPGEALVKRTIENLLNATFGQWGYEEVATPTFEYLTVFDSANNEDVSAGFKFFGRDNNALMLRSDMTRPIARIAGTHFRPEDLPLRLSYVSNIFRYEEIQAGRQCEFTQGGVEFIGTAGTAADAEVVALAVAALRAAGVENFTVNIGHSAFLTGLLEGVNLTDTDRDALKKAVLAHDLVGLENLLTETELPEALKELLSKVLLLHGGEEMLRELKQKTESSKSLGALNNLLELSGLLKAYGVNDTVRFDLSLMRSLDYYTGMVFEIYVPGMGFPLGGGGRYDKLMLVGDTPCPATGFALGVERIMMVLRRQGKTLCQTGWDIFVAWREGFLPEALQRSGQLRAAGKSVKVAAEALRAEEAETAGYAAHCRSTIFIG